jgi:glycosidase
VLCIFCYFGCTKKEYADLNARQSTAWIKNAVIYEVYLRSFSKEGTFKALEVQIPELKKLGVTIVSLLPIHPIGELNRMGSLGSPYAVKDFYAVNPEYGTLDDFKSLVNTVHQQNMKIIIELVADRAAWDSRLLMEHPDWFAHNAEGAIVSPNSDCLDAAQLDYVQHEPRKYMIAMMKFWVQNIGIDGFKCSSAELVPTDFWNIARAELEKIKPVVMISDDSLPEHHVKAFDMTCSWNISDALTRITNSTASASIFDDSLKTELRLFPKGSLHLRYIKTYSKNVEDVCAIEPFTAQIAQAAAVLAFTLPGVPLIFNGEEAGNSRRVDLFDKVDIDWTHGSDFQKLYETLSALRCFHPALRYGKYVNVANTENKHVFSFFRLDGTDTVLVIINFRKEKKEVSVNMPASSSITWNDRFSNISLQVKDTCLSAVLAPLEYLVLIPNIRKEQK